MAAYNLPLGHFHLSLRTNNEDPIDDVTADYKQRVLENYLERKANRPERHAIRNLLGLQAYRLGRRETAQEHFEFILKVEEDPDNLNAKANLDFMRDGGADPAPSDEPDLTTEAAQRQQARRYAEQAFAHMFELYDETVTCDRYEKGFQLYEKAMELAGDLVCHTEKEDWQFGKGLASYKILCASGRDRGRAQTSLDSACEMFGALRDSPDADSAIKCEAWLQLFLSLKNGSNTRLELPGEFADQPLGICLENALQLAPDDALRARILARKAQYIFKTDSVAGFERAKVLLEDSISLDSSDFNFHAYSARANIYIKKYKSQVLVLGSGDTGLIRQAKDDLEFILKLHVSPWDFAHLAEVCLDLAKSTGGEEAEEYITKAQEASEKALLCQDGKERPDVHLIRGKILRFQGQHQEAAQSFERGVECEGRTGQRLGNQAALDEVNQYIRGQRR